MICFVCVWSFYRNHSQWQISVCNCCTDGWVGSKQALQPAARDIDLFISSPTLPYCMIMILPHYIAVSPHPYYPTVWSLYCCIFSPILPYCMIIILLYLLTHTILLYDHVIVPLYCCISSPMLPYCMIMILPHYMADIGLLFCCNGHIYDQHYLLLGLSLRLLFYVGFLQVWEVC